MHVGVAREHAPKPSDHFAPLHRKLRTVALEANRLLELQTPAAHDVIVGLVVGQLAGGFAPAALLLLRDEALAIDATVPVAVVAVVDGRLGAGARGAEFGLKKQVAPGFVE